MNNVQFFISSLIAISIVVSVLLLIYCGITTYKLRSKLNSCQNIAKHVKSCMKMLDRAVQFRTPEITRLYQEINENLNEIIKG